MKIKMTYIAFLISSLVIKRKKNAKANLKLSSKFSVMTRGYFLTQLLYSSIGWGWLHLCRGVRPHPTKRFLHMALSLLMVRLQLLSFRECEVSLHRQYFQVHFDQEW